MSESVTVHGAGRDNRTVKPGQNLVTAYAGPEDLRVALQQNLAEPLSLASADFDEDGIPDLVSGYSYNGRGIISLLRGNVDSIYPNAPEAQQRQADGTFTDAPFLSPAQVFEAPSAADFVGTGDFDADGHWDVVIAARTAKALYLLSGDGLGGLALTRQVPLPGAVTAMTTGEINRPDGLTDIVIGVEGPAGPQVLVFEGPEGAMRAKPEVFEFRAAPTAFALGQFGGLSENELVIAAGAELVMIYGRDRKLSLNASEQSKVTAATVEHRVMPYLISALAGGDFIWDKAHQADLALLATDGHVHFLSVDQGAKAVDGMQAKTPNSKLALREQRAVSVPAASSTSSPSLNALTSGRMLVTARMSVHQTDDLLLVETGQQQIHLVNADPAQRDETGQLLEADAPTEATTVALNAETSPVAVLPMRLNRAASNSLVMLQRAQTTPTVVAAAAGAIITVNSSDDTNVRDNVVTLREAILLANGGTSAAGGLSKAELTPAEQAQVQGTPNANQLDEIRFNIPTIAQNSADTSESAMATEASESHGRQSVDGSSPTYLAEYAQSQMPPTEVGGLFKSSLTTPLRLDLETSTDFRLGYPDRWLAQTSSLSVNHPPTPVGGIQLAPISYRIESAGQFSTAPVEAVNFAQRTTSTTATLTQSLDASNESLSQSSMRNSQLTQNDSPDAFSCTTPSFGARNTIRLSNGGIEPRALAIGDLNGDGKPDVVTANSISNDITVLLGNGAGGFGTPKSFSLGAGASYPSSIAIGDFNGDGKPDVVTANSTSNSITVLLGNGAGGFGAPNTFNLGASPNAVAVTDFNGDGNPDVVTANGSGSITVLLGNGARGFSSPNSFSLGAGVSTPSSIAVGDFNGDGRPDVVTANSSSNNITVLLGNGAGGFGTPNSFSLGTDGRSPSAVAVGDFNGDGKTDVVTGNFNTANITVLLGNGAGGFDSPNTFGVNGIPNTGYAPKSIAIGDFNGDGRTDVWTVDAFGNITILLGNGAGGFGTPITFTVDTQSGPSSFIAIGDLNGDGKPDVVRANTGSNSITVLLGNGGGGFAAPVTFNLGLDVGVSLPNSVAVGDFNGDGKTDVVTANIDSNNITVLLGSGGGGFGTPNTFNLTTGTSYPASIAIGDFNGDGKPDVVLANGYRQMTVLLGDGAGGFGAPNNFSLGTDAGSPDAVAVGDFNGDGKLDVVTANTVPNTITILLGNGAGGFGAPNTFSLGAGVALTNSVAVGDFNADGKLDVVVGNIGSANVTVLLGNGTGGFGAPNTFSLGSDTKTTFSVAVGDFNADGKPDIVTANNNSGIYSANVVVLLGNGAGGFGAPNGYILGPAIPDAVAIGDFNGDGKPDIVTANDFPASITVLLGNGAGGFGAPNSFFLGTGVKFFGTNVSPQLIAIGDFNGDGKPDVVMGNDLSNNIMTLLNTCGSDGGAPDLTLSKSHTGNFTVGAQGTFRFAVTNVGTGTTIGATTITDNLPAGLSFAGISGNNADLAGWICSFSGRTVNCTNSILLLPTTTATVNMIVSVNQFVVPSLINSATVTTQGDNNTANNTASDSARVGVACVSQPINIGQTINGTLSTTDCFSPFNRNSPYADHYTFTGKAGQPIAITLSSSDFDTFLYLIGPDGAVIGLDDDGGGGTNSRILAGSGFFILPTNGTYTIEATSARTNETGNYTLSLTTGTPTCTYSIAPTSQAFSGAGGSATVAVTTPNNCGWTAISNSSFITINGGANGTGNGTVGITVAANSTNSPRTGTLTIAGQTFTVTQAAGAACVYSINPTSQTFAAVGGSGSASVVTPNGCAWTATSNASFIIVNGGSGNGNGIASFTVIANTSFTARTGTLTIAGQTFTVVQGGATAKTFAINLVSPLPKITDSIIIDGATQPGFSNAPLIIINGSGLGSTGGGNGLVITAGSSTVRSLNITGFASNNRDAAILMITNGGNVVEGCYIGTDVSGARSFGPRGGPDSIASGISIRSSSGNRLGGTTAAARNLVSGVDGAGIIITTGSTSNLVQGNYIGTDVTGSLSLGRQRIGVYIQSASGNTIGGTAAGAGNLISGNTDYGVYLQDDAHNNLVVGNIIGANGAGVGAVPNGNAGVFIYNPTGPTTPTLDNTIGGTTPAARNIISGNDPYGIVLGQGATGTLVQGNYVGTKADGAAALPNTYGITATQATGSTIGGPIDAARNVISGNTLTGVSIGFLNNGQLGGTGTTVQGNYIGTNATGTGPLGNLGDGVFVEVQSVTHTVQNNLIAFNGGNGVRIPNVTANPGTPGVRIQIVDNSIFSNAALAIDLGPAGITPNDVGDADAGANLLQNFPVLTSLSAVSPIDDRSARLADEQAQVITVNATLNSTPNTAFTVHWYFSADAQCTMNQQGSRPLVSGRVPGVTTDNNGNASFNFPFDFPAAITNGVINCTATDPNGNTSEFSACLPVSGTSPQWQPVVLTAQQIAQIKAWTVGGRTYVYVKPQFPDAGYRVVNWGQVGRSGGDFTVDASVERFTGASIQSVVTTAQIYDLGPLADGTYNFNFKTSGTLVKTLQFTVTSATPPPNPIDDARQFVKQQYRDFLNREADQAGEDFWTDNITKCSDPARRPAGQTEAQCTLRQRETTSGAFFRSPEFQYTGDFVLRMYKGALGRQPKLSEFTPDAQFVDAGIIVNSQLSAAKINQNKADFAAQFVNCTDPAKYRCAEFKMIYDGLNNQQYVDKLFLTTGVNASASDRTALVNGLNGGTETRASVLQKVVDGIVVIAEGNQQFTTTYGQAFYNSESNRAFVQLEYFGYMKRDPDDAGYAFWLGKLNQFNGNFVNAEMVLAFISSPEYRARFGQP